MPYNIHRKYVFYLEYATVWILKKCILFVLYLIKVISSNKTHVTAFVFEKTSFLAWIQIVFGTTLNVMQQQCSVIVLFLSFFFSNAMFFFDGQFILRYCRLCVFILARLHFFFVSRSKDACSVKLSEWSIQQIILKWLKRYRHYTLSYLIHV